MTVLPLYSQKSQLCLFWGQFNLATSICTHLVLNFSLVLSFAFFKIRDNIQIWSCHWRNCLVCSTCNLRAMRIYEQSIFWFIGSTLLSVKRKLFSCSPCSYQYAWLLNVSAYWGPGVWDTYSGTVRPLLLISIRNEGNKG